MLSDEEKKAIGQCRLLLNGDITLHIIDDDGGTAYCGIVNKEYNKDLETVLNLIEKQSKEIEELKEKTKKCEYYEMVAYELYKNSVSKDKIKAKIEEFKKVRDIILENEKELNRPMMTYDLKRNDYCEKMLQSLLEKE